MHVVQHVLVCFSAPSNRWLCRRDGEPIVEKALEWSRADPTPNWFRPSPVALTPLARGALGPKNPGRLRSQKMLLVATLIGSENSESEWPER